MKYKTKSYVSLNLQRNLNPTVTVKTIKLLVCFFLLSTNFYLNQCKCKNKTKPRHEKTAMPALGGGNLAAVLFGKC